MNCPRCQAEITANMKFCPECSQRIATNIGFDGGVTLGGMQTMAGDVSLGQMATQVSAARPDGGTGQKIGERYEVLTELGRGGFAVVYRAKDLKLGREVAVKRLQVSAMHGAMGQQVMERFAREAQTIAALNHRNIVMVYDNDQDDEGAYVVMEHVGHGSLRDLVKSKGGKLEVPEAVELIKGVARGLAYAHRKNLVHRDIKPANILLAKESGEMIPKIVDFGLARMGGESELSMSGMGMGTPWYMPPEQRQNAKGVNHTADLYALGKTLYELITGEVPDTVEVEKLPEWLRPVVQRCIKNNPEERYFNAEDLLKDLEKPQTVTAPPVQKKPVLRAGQCPACGEMNGKGDRFCKRCGGTMPISHDANLFKNLFYFATTIMDRRDIPRKPAFVVAGNGLLQSVCQGLNLLVQENTLRAEARRIFLGVLIIVGLILLETVLFSFRSVRNYYLGGLYFAQWIAIVRAFGIAVVLFMLYWPVKAILTHYLKTWVKVGMLPERDKYLKDVTGAAKGLTLLVFLLTIYSCLELAIDQINSSFMHFRSLFTTLNWIVIGAVIWLSFCLWKNGKPLFLLLTGRVAGTGAVAADGILCPACQTKNDSDAAFCAVCGLKMEPKPAPPALNNITGSPVADDCGEQVNCPACNAQNDLDAGFCAACGCKIEPKPAAAVISAVPQVTLATGHQVNCPACNAQNDPEVAFCAACGTKIGSKPAPPLPVEPATSPAAGAKLSADEGIRFHCPGCNQSFKASTEQAGNQFDCPVCKKPIIVPGVQPPKSRRRAEENIAST